MTFLFICAATFAGFLAFRMIRLERRLEELTEIYALDKEEMAKCLDVNYDVHGNIKNMKFKRTASK